MNIKRNIYYRIGIVATLISFLMNGICFGAIKPGTSNISTAPNAFEGAVNKDVNVESGSFKTNVQKDIIRLSMAGFIANIMKPWDKAFDNTKVDLKKELAAFIGTSPEQEAYLDVKIDLDQVEIREEAVFIPFSDMDILVARKKDLKKMAKGWKQLEMTDELAFLIKETKDLKGAKAPKTNPVIQNLIEQGVMIEIFLNTETQELDASRILWLDGYMPGAVSSEFYRGQKIELNQIFNEEELGNLKEWIEAHKTRGEHVKFRVALGRAGLGWESDIDHANISHAGMKDRSIYIGDMLLKKMMRQEGKVLRQAILEEDEYRHLQGLSHGTEEAVKNRLQMVAASLGNMRSDFMVEYEENIKNLLDNLLKNGETEAERKTRMEFKKEQEKQKTLLSQVKVPDPEKYPEANAVYNVTKKVIEGKAKEAFLVFLAHHAAGKPDSVRDITAEVSNALIWGYERDGSKGNAIRGFLAIVRDNIANYTNNNPDDIQLAKDVQLMLGQTETILSWIDRHVPGAEDLRLTTDEVNMPESPKEKSFIDKSTIPEDVGITNTEDKPGLYWRGTEGYLKIEKEEYERANIIEQAINRRVPKSIREKLEQKLVLYLMDHGFIKVPEKLKPLTKEGGRITTMHETYFLNNTLPLSAQMTSTGPGHFQSNGLDIKQVTEGSGVQVNVLYDAENNIKDVIMHRVQEGNWTISIPGYVDYMVNTGGLRFNDICVRLDKDKEEMLLKTFNPDWDVVKDAKVSPVVAPIMAYYDNGEKVFVRNARLADDVAIREIPRDTFTKDMSRIMSLMDVYKYKLFAGEKKIDKMVAVLAEALTSGKARADKPALLPEEDAKETKEQQEPISFGKSEGINDYIEDNVSFLTDAFKDKAGTKKLIRVAIEAIFKDETTDETIIEFFKTLEETGKFDVQLYSSESPELTVPSGTYDRYGLTSPEHIEIARENIITILPVDNKSYEFTPSIHNMCWKALGKTPEGKELEPKDTIIMPIGANYDKAGMIRSVLLGLRLSEIRAKNDSEEKALEDDFVASTVLQYRDFAVSQGVEPKTVNKVTGKDIVALAFYPDIEIFTASLNRLIRSLPIVPLNVEELKEAYLRAREAMIRA